MTKAAYARIFAVLFIICALLAGIYSNLSGGNPNALSSRAVMVFCVRR